MKLTKLIAMLLSLTLLVGVLPVTGFAEETNLSVETDENFSGGGVH